MTDHLSSSTQQAFHEPMMENPNKPIGNNPQLKMSSGMSSCQWKALAPERIREIAEEIKKKQTHHGDCARDFVYGP